MSGETTSSEPQSTISALRHSARTDIGMRREENQDSFGIIEGPNYKFFIVADGMGGVKGGAIASGIAVEVLKSEFQGVVQIGAEEIVSALQKANTEILQKASGDPALAGMGTTLVGLAFVDTGVYVVNVGDSRAYRVRGDRIKQLTDDHTLVMELVRSGTLKKDQIQNHPVSHMLTRSLGPTAEIQVDCTLCNDGPARGDVYVLCSDGLYNLVTDDEISTILQEYPLEQATEKLIHYANERGGSDNITAIAIEIGDEFPVGAEAFPEEEREDEDLGINGKGSLDGHEDTLNGTYSDENISEEANKSKGRSSNGKPSVSVESNVSLEELRKRHRDEEAEVIARDVARDESTAKANGLRKGKPKESKDLKVTFTNAFARMAALGVVAGCIGFLIARAVFSPGTDRPSEVNLTSLKPELPPEPKVSAVELQFPFSEQKSFAQLQMPTLSLLTDDGKALDVKTTIQEFPVVPDGENKGSGGTLSLSERGNILRRQQALRAQLVDLGEKLVAFEEPISGRLAQALDQGARDVESLRVKLENVREQIDIATRKLAVWYGRRTRLHETDPVTLASEVAVSSEEVREKKNLFESATWSYLKESEVLKYNPADVSQKEKVNQLVKERKQRLTELVQEVEKAIEKAVREANEEVSNLTLERDRIEERINTLNHDLEYAKVLMGSDPKAKELKKKELLKEKESAAAELEELNRILPWGGEEKGE